MKKYLQAIGIWCLIIPLAVINGGIREYVLASLGNAALPLSGILLSICILAMAFWLVPKIKDCSRRDYMLFGIMWFILTNLFDWGMILAEGGGILNLFQLYNFTTGNLWIIVVLAAAFSPYWAGSMKKGSAVSFKEHNK